MRRRFDHDKRVALTKGLPVDSDNLTPSSPEAMGLKIRRTDSRTLGIDTNEVGVVVLDELIHARFHVPIRMVL